MPTHESTARPANTPDGRDLYLAGYDISCPKRLVAALKLVRGHATGGQKSVHEVMLTAGERRLLLDGMRAILDEDEDRFFLLKLDRRATVITRGIAAAPEDGRFYLVS